MRATTTPILILGAGPAGGTVALGLTRLGYRVTLVTRPRPFEALEGISERVLAGLRGAGFHHALAAVPDPTPRQALWNGTETRANTERLVHRAELDRAILKDLQDAGVRVIQGQVRQLKRLTDGYQVTVSSGADSWQLSAGLLVEARGRRAPGQGGARQRGPTTVSLLQRWQGAGLSRRSAVESFADGWAWIALGEAGRGYLQLTLDAQQRSLPPREQQAALLQERLDESQLARLLLAGAAPAGPLVARASTAILQQDAVGTDWIRVGDAAMAVDPLSGNGIFQALSSALLAPAVINTMLNRPTQGKLAREFYRQRLEHLFLRFARLGRDFYRLEGGYLQKDFWRLRAAWPDDLPVHAASQDSPVSIARRPVVREGYIETQPVLLTADQPLGVWQVAGIAIAPLLEQLRREPLDAAEHPGEQLRRRWPMSAEQAQHIIGWLRQYGLV